MFNFMIKIRLSGRSTVMVACTTVMVYSVTGWDVTWQAWAWTSKDTHDNADQPLVLRDLTLGSGHSASIT